MQSGNHFPQKTGRYNDMNGKERAQLAFAHKEADRVPIFELTIDNTTTSTFIYSGAIM